MSSLLMTQSLRLTQKQQLTQQQRLTQAQSLVINQMQLQRHRDLVEALHGDKFEPKARCPKCQHPLTDFEIMKGFRDDPRDYTTGCPKCKHRFHAKLHRSTDIGWVEMAFYCPSQTLDQMQNLVEVPLDTFRAKYASVYNSAVVHFGGLKQAFQKINLTYTHEADLDWKNQVGPFLGKMADTVIAQLVGAAVKEVRALRKERGVRTYNRRREAEALA